MIDVSDLIGVPFVEFGRDARTGLDCYGLAIEVCRRAGKELRDVVLEKFDRGKVRRTLPSLNLRRIGAVRECAVLEFYGRRDGRLHVGVALDGGTFVHATEAQGVRISSLRSAEDYLELAAVYEVV